MNAIDFLEKYSKNYNKTCIENEKTLYHLSVNGYECLRMMAEFARYHVQKALEAAADNSVKLSSTKQTVIASYPLENIK